MPPIPASAPRSIPDECTQEVVDIIETCLDPNPHARPTAVQLAQMLQRAPTGLAGGDAGSSAANSMQLPPPQPSGGLQRLASAQTALDTPAVVDDTAAAAAAATPGERAGSLEMPKSLPLAWHNGPLDEAELPTSIGSEHPLSAVSGTRRGTAHRCEPVCCQGGPSRGRKGGKQEMSFFPVAHFALSPGTEGIPAEI